MADDINDLTYSTLKKHANGVISRRTTLVDDSGVAFGSTGNALDVNVKSSSTTGNVADNGVDSGNPVKIGGAVHTSTQTYSDGDRADMQMDINGNEFVRETYAPASEDNNNGLTAVALKPHANAGYSPTIYSYWAGSVTKANIKASAGNVFSILVTNTNASIRWFLLHNKASAPAATEAGLFAFPIPGGSVNSPGSVLIDSTWFANMGNFSTGIGWSVGTTAATFTDSATAGDHTVMVNYL